MTNYEVLKRRIITDKNRAESLKALKKILEEASEAYYNKDTVLISDQTYDELYKLYTKYSHDTIIGAEPPKGSKTVSVQHDYQNLVGTLDKAQTYDEIEPYLTKYSKVTVKKPYKVRLSLKFDGNSITIEYDKDGNPKKALTRGKNGKGKDIIQAFINDKIDMSPFNLSCLDSEFAVKFEAILPYEFYDKLCEESGEDYSNPRSLVSGLLNGNDAAKYRKYITLVPLEMRVKDEGFSYEKGYKKLYEKEIEEAFPDNFFNQYSKIVTGTMSEVSKAIEEYYNHVNEIRQKLPFMIDGIVIEFLNEEIIKEFFYDPKGLIPQYAFAAKLPYLEAITTVTGIDYCVGNSSRITPRIHFEPVNFNGTTHTKQQISNYKRFKELNLGVGSLILVSYHSDCLSYITKVEDQPKGIKPFEFIKNCPKCGSKITIVKNSKGELTLANCSNPNCLGRTLGKLENYFKGMDIKGIKMNIINDLYENNLISDIPSLYNMDYTKVAKLLGPKVAENIKTAIESKEYFDYEILGSLSITNFNLESSKLLCKNYTLDEIIDMYNDDTLKDKILEIEGFGDITAEYFLKGFEENSDAIEFLYSRGYKNYKDNFSDTMLNLNIAVTGWRPDPELSIKLESMGVQIKSSVSKKVDILVYSGSPGATKTNKAQELGVEIISKEEFFNRYGLG